MKRLLTYLEEDRRDCILAPLFKMLEAMFELFVPIVVSNMIDVGIVNQDVPYILIRCLLLLLLAAIGLTCSVMAQYFAAKAATNCATRLRHHLFAHIQGLSFTEMDTIGTSTLVTRMTSDINMVQNGVNMVLRLFLRAPVIVFGAMIMAFTINVPAAMIFVVVIPLLALVVFGIMLLTKPMYKKVQGDLDQILGVLHENLTGARVIRAFNKETEEIARFKTDNAALNKQQRHAGRYAGLMNPLTYVIINLGIVALLWTGALQVNIGNLTQGQVVALYNYMSQILVELIKLANLIMTITKAVASMNRVNSIFDITSSMQDGQLTASDAVMQDGLVQDGVVQDGAMPAGVISSGTAEQAVPAVEFRHVHLQYAGAGGESLTDIDFRLERGQTLGIIGGTGAGKSSLVNMIPRFYDACEGEVLLGGVNVKEYRLHVLRRKVGIVLQKALLFKGTIRENLQWGKKEATDTELWEALELSQAAEFVRKKPEQLDDFVDQGGKNLSGGQRQRLTIARALVGKPEVLILDDSASALDFATDAALRHAIRHMQQAPTLILVSQRAASLMHADRILVLDDGEMAGFGTHEELLQSNPIYQEIYYSQFPKTTDGTDADSQQKEAQQ